MEHGTSRQLPKSASLSAAQASVEGEQWTYLCVDMDGYGGINRLVGYDIKRGDTVVLSKLPITQVIANRICEAANASLLRVAQQSEQLRIKGRALLDKLNHYTSLGFKYDKEFREFKEALRVAQAAQDWEKKFHDLEAENVRRIKHLNRLGSWAQQDPTGPDRAADIQRWVLNEIKAALGAEYKPSEWEPSYIQLQDEVRKLRAQAVAQQDEKQDSGEQGDQS